MRPRKVILLVDPLEDRGGTTRFVLDTMGHYAAIDCPSVFAAAEIGHECHVDLMLGYAPVSEHYLIEVAAGLGCPWMYVAPVVTEVYQLGNWPSMADVLERIRIATARKRGPKKGVNVHRREEVA